MLKKWFLGGLAAAALGAALLTYHLAVVSHSAKHFRLLLEAPTVESKRQHFDQIYRFYHPWNPYHEKACRWLAEDGHEWEFLGYPPGGPCR